MNHELKYNKILEQKKWFIDFLITLEHIKQRNMKCYTAGTKKTQYKFDTKWQKTRESQETEGAMYSNNKNS